MVEHTDNTDFLFEEISTLMKNGDYITAYNQLNNELLVNNSKAISIKAFLNYCGYVQFEPQNKSIKTLRDLSEANSQDATFFLASAYLIPGIFESINSAIPHSIDLLKKLYQQKYTKSFILYSNLLLNSGEYDRVLEVLKEAEEISSIPISEILQQKVALIMLRRESIDELPNIFNQCVELYQNHNYSICSLYANFLLNKDGDFFDPALGLKVLEEGVKHSNRDCLILKSRLLVSFSGYIKRDVNLAVGILNEIIEKNKHDHGAKLFLSQIYLQDDQFKNEAYAVDAVKLLSDSYWYCDLNAINLYLGTIIKYKIYDEKNYVAALEMKAKLEGKNNKLMFKAFKVFWLLSKPLDSALKFLVLILSFIIAFILAAIRVTFFYLSVFIRRFFK